MPTPPKKNEAEQEFVSRCIAELTDTGEGESPEQRAAICYSIYRSKDKKKSDIILSDEIMKIADIIKQSALKPIDKKVVDAFYDKKPADGKSLETNGKKLETIFLGKQIIAKWNGNNIVIVCNVDSKYVESVLKYLKKSIPKGNFDVESYKKYFK